MHIYFEKWTDCQCNIEYTAVYSMCVGGGGFFDPLLIFYVCPLTKNDQSINVMVGLFGQ